MVAASEVIALRTRSAALALGGACQLLQFAVKFFDLAAQLVRRDLLQWSHDLSAMGTGAVPVSLRVLAVLQWSDDLSAVDTTGRATIACPMPGRRRKRLL